MLLPLFTILIIIIGLAVGSFLNVVADRLPRGESIVSPPSHCTTCGQRLLPLEMIPVVSYLWLRGRCRRCSAPIGRRVFFTEVAGGLIALAAVWLFGLTMNSLLAAMYGWVFLLLSVMDIEHRRVYGAVIVPALLLALVGSPWWLPAGGLVGASLGALIVCLPYAVLYIVARRVYGRGRGMGLGDVKVAVLVGLITGFPGAFAALYATLLVGGGVAMFLVLSGRRKRSDALPMVPFFTVGLLIGVLWGSGYLLWLVRLINPL